MKKKYPLPGEKWRDIDYGATLVLRLDRANYVVLFRYLTRNGSPYNSSYGHSQWQSWMRYT